MQALLMFSDFNGERQNASSKQALLLLRGDRKHGPANKTPRLLLFSTTILQERRLLGMSGNGFNFFSRSLINKS